MVVYEKLFAKRGATSDEMATLVHMAVLCTGDPVRSVDELVLDGVGRYAARFGKDVVCESLCSCEIAG
jgi:hypothetical protein